MRIRISFTKLKLVQVQVNDIPIVPQICADATCIISPEFEKVLDFAQHTHDKIRQDAHQQLDEIKEINDSLHEQLLVEYHKSDDFLQVLCNYLHGQYVSSKFTVNVLNEFMHEFEQQYDTACKHNDVARVRISQCRNWKIDIPDIATMTMP